MTSSDPAGEQWYVLQHEPGPVLAGDGSVFAHPLFAEHVAFLQRLRQAGLLVAAGPLPDQDGAGMTVLRSSGDPDADEVHRLATEDDRSVAGGLLTVRVRPWRVMFSAQVVP